MIPLPTLSQLRYTETFRTEAQFPESGRTGEAARWPIADRNWGRRRLEQMMPKQKTHKATKKRFRLSANGKPMHRQAGTSHLAAGMSQKRKRHLRGTTAVDKTVHKSIRTALNGNSY